LRKLAIAILFGLFFTVGAAPQAEAGSVTFCFTNKASSIIYLRAFSENRNVVWPASGYWYLNDRAQHCTLLACRSGEHICYGGDNGAGTYWGVGYDGNYGCSSCCGYCNGGTYSWNLTD
jgi:hypothetical protein